MFVVAKEKKSDNHLLIENVHTNETIRISNVNNSIKVSVFNNKPSSTHSLCLPVQTIIGILHVKGGAVLLAVDKMEKSSSGPYNKDDNINVIKNAIGIPISSDIIEANKDYIHYSNQTLLAMTLSLLSSGYFYYSHNCDLTNSLQRQLGKNKSTNTESVSLWDKRWVWNFSLLADFIPVKLGGRLEEEVPLASFLTPIICGHVEGGMGLSMKGEKIDFFLIARKSALNQGTRYNKRGVDTSGNAANFCEIEQIVYRQKTNEIFSFVQVRGSIPVVWKQVPDLKAVPRVEFHESSDTQSKACNGHFKKLENFYGNNIICVNLVSKSGDQKRLTQKYEAFKPNTVKLVSFDFNHECRNLKYENLSFLLERIEEDWSKVGYFHYDKEEKKVKGEQIGVFRTNCLDNLDRTNVVQGLLGRHIVLQVMGCKEEEIKKAVMTSQYTNMEKTFKNIWTNAGDVISLNYAGTGALKTDFTRTGKRTILGAISDAKRSVARYFYNNFQDGNVQDSIDLVLCNYVEGQGKDRERKKYYGPAWLMKFGGGAIFAVHPRLLSPSYSEFK